MKKLFAVVLLAVIAVLFGCIGFGLPAWASAEGLNALPESANLVGIVEQYAVIPVTVFCLGVGFVLKNALPKFNNNYIPLILFPVALVGVLWTRNWAFTPDTFFAGFCSAAMAVYIHSGGKHALEALMAKKEEPKPPEQ